MERTSADRGWLGRLALVVIASLTAVGGAGAAQAAPAPPPSPTPSTASTASTYIVRFKAGADVREQAMSAAAEGAQVTRTVTHVFSGMLARLTSAQREALSMDPDVESIEADQPIRATDMQPDATWGLDRVDQRALPLSTTYIYGATGQGVTAYVLDTGVLATHADFGGRVVAGYTAVLDGGGTTDCMGHGTHVSGTIAGTRFGVAKQATIVPVRVLDCGGTGWASWAISGLDWIAGVHQSGQPAVANMSLGGNPSPSLEAAVAGLIDDGVTVVVAAGNETMSACDESPSRVPDALTVASMTSADLQAATSNSGPCVDLYAPGESIMSDWYTSTTDTATASGTSMASPHVAGAAALVLSRHPTWTPAQVMSQILENATVNAVRNATPGTPNRLLYAPSSDAERYVTRVYLDLFERTPDPQGLATWVTALQAGEPRISVANSITYSAEYRSRLIHGSYLTYLGREPEPAGLADWLGRMGRELTIQEMEAGFLASQENHNNAGNDDAEWIRRLYLAVLTRSAGASEVDYWLGWLHAPGGSRFGVAIGFLNSTEHLTTVVDAQYQHLLGRRIDPSGQRTWVGAIQGGTRLEAIIGSIIASQEYYNRI